MIKLLGFENSSEYGAAQKIINSLISLWPDLDDSADDNILVMAGCKIFGYEVQDIDIVIVVEFQSHRFFQPLRPLNCQQDGVVVRKDVFVKNLVIVVEVKSHSQNSVYFEGISSTVVYKNEKKHDATEQSVKQAHTLRRYLSNNFNENYFVINLLYFENLEELDLPKRPHNIIAGRLSGRYFLTVVAEVSKPWMRPSDSRAIISSCNEGTIRKVFTAPIFKVLKPTILDRKKMERISNQLGFDKKCFDSLGKKLIILRGQGGTGKTLSLLQLAYRAYEDSNSRTLILTYNLALVSDMRRVMALMRLPSGIEEGGIHIESVMAFMGKILKTFGFVEEDIDFLDQYDDSIRNLSETLINEDFPKSEIMSLLNSSNYKFDFENIMIDEAQDWPINEIRILKACYPSNHFVIADGIDQLVRGARATWTDGISPNETSVFPLRSSLRMKKNLAIFNNALAEELGLEGWHVTPNDEIKGGQIIILKDGDFSFPNYYKNIIDAAISAGNSYIDILFCISSDWAYINKTTGLSNISNLLDSINLSCWDGTRADIRRDFPRDTSHARVVHFESCRGLEGWTVFCLGLGVFLNKQLHITKNTSLDVASGLSSPEELARLALARWALMATTRAIDTLVIQDIESCPMFFKALTNINLRYPDIISWR